ncbi:activating signal cointegrator 1 complex subunit 3 [Condylostylus longicornis]|uniref:activating signal cointegrator 1 complex subunit 3 n=1 Tax=Condylostylus longicornis TaxID=2530218 RepID=UPI00244DA992|nr:activating signal cointegrator 1 complex subunit 3 [Condylostylus longicornis]
MLPLPRLSRALRANTDLEISRSLKLTSEEKINLKLWRSQTNKKSICWKSLKDAITESVSSEEDVKKLLENLQKLWVMTREMIGNDESSEVINDAAVFILTLFLDVKIVMNKHINILKNMFGTILPQLANKMCSVVHEISCMLNDEARSYIERISNDVCAELNGSDSEGACSITTWGSQITVDLSNNDRDDVPLELLQNLSPNLAANAKTALTFSMEYNARIKENSNDISAKCGKYSKAWFSTYVGEELINSLIEVLKSTKSNDELQNDLFEFLGFDKFELIEDILNNRAVVIDKFENDEKKMKLKSMIRSKEQLKNIQKSSKERPPPVATVLVQSEQERQLKKQVRRDEKKLNRLINNVAKDLEDLEDDVINPAKLRLQHQQNLLATASRQPIFKENIEMLTAERLAKISQVSEKYPFVFDSQIEAKLHAGFIAGNKLMLPENVERKDAKTHEEVKIPATEPPPLSVGNNRIQISNLDEIGQTCFRNTKELNRIQSVVYPVAYHSNENMLVCAPTGAGKTNVAMLTVANTIRSFTDQGVIHRDQFKIVYVAPMKALAAEMVENFQKRLQPLNILVRELTGDMQLTKLEMQQTQMLVTTPEKWDVVTRKGAGDVALITLVKLLIIDEVHLLHGERGPVVEALVARTLRLVESSQSMIRIVGLSATLPNYIDVARFLRVNPMKGLFYFDSRFRPVPLSTTFIGVKSLKPLQQLAEMDQICYDKCVDFLRQKHQVMVFVHARNATTRTATVLRELAQQKGQLSLFTPEDNAQLGIAQKSISKSRNKQLIDLFNSGIAMHHAGMLRSDRNMVEKYFAEGQIRVLVCTATLAWGVNLPAHAVIIKGTEIYDSKHGSFVDLGILDVLQIFGRAGRPQFDKSGSGTIITTHDKLNHYLSLLTNQFPIESNFIQCLADNLNAEITLGTISNVDEAIEWLSYTYLFVRMKINPQVYGLNYIDVQRDPSLEVKRRELIKSAAMSLDKARMIRFNERTGDLNITDLGRTASHFYIKYDTVEIFNELMIPFMNEGQILAMMSQAHEFQQLKVRDDELEELDELTREYSEVPVQGGSENVHGKVNILMQTYLSRGFCKSFSLVSDLSYITQNAVRIARALFTIVLRNNDAVLAGRILAISKMFEKQMWEHETPLRQFTCLGPEIIEKIENRGISILALREMDSKEIGIFLRNQRYGSLVSKCAHEFPMVEIEANLQPITRTVLRIRIFITANFKWNDRVHGKHSLPFWLWIEDTESNLIYHSEYFQLTKKAVILKDAQELVMTIPLKDPLPSQYIIRVTSDTWLGSYESAALSFQHLILPEIHPPHTELLPLQPLPVSVLNNKEYESLYPFTHFNPIQTQIFHCLYHSDNNVLLGAPTGSGKTIAAEIAIFRVFEKYPKGKIVYIAPLKALVRERIDDWKIRLEQKLGKKVVELTGDVTPDIKAIRESTVIVTTPEKWDGISRSWQTRDYVRDVALIVIDEIHLLGEDRGPVLEVIVSRTNFIASHTTRTLRIIGLSTALANAIDLANWLGITQMGLYNFKPSVRPVPLSVHISGFPGKHYCPRMATMNRPTFQAIRQYSPCTPALIFVSSRRQTRLTALDLIAFLAGEDNPKQFLHIPEEEMDQILINIKDANLKLTLAFGIGMHHAGLTERDRKTCEELFLHRKIQILVATATLAWGVNLPAHLVVIKGTEYYDGKQKRYVDMPITDVLQMMGRAGRPQFGNEGVAVVLVHDVKKNFYKKFLYDPFPVESSLLEVLPDHINAEIVAGTVQTKQAVLDYFTWTYFFRRLLRNPTYYGLESIEPKEVNSFLSGLVEQVCNVLESSGCLQIDERFLYPTPMGRISSYYYISHQTMRHFADSLRFEMKMEEVLRVMCDAYEFSQQPVRHNEDVYNAELAKLCRIKVDPLTYDSPHTKTFLLMQAHFSHLPLPNSDYLTDTKSVLDQSIRVLQAMIDVVGERGWLGTTLQIQLIMQSVIQAHWYDEIEILTLPHVDEFNCDVFNKIKHNYPVLTLPVIKEISVKNYEKLAGPLREKFSEPEIEQIYKVICDMPTLNVEISIAGSYKNHFDITRPIEYVADGKKSMETWIEVHAMQEYTVNVYLHRLGPARNDSKIYSPKFPKGKDEGWFLTLGCVGNGEMIALKRIGYRSNKSSHQITFVTPSNKGRIIYTLYIISDGYIGFDQQYDLQLNVIDPRKSLETDENVIDSNVFLNNITDKEKY